MRMTVRTLVGICLAIVLGAGSASVIGPPSGFADQCLRVVGVDSQVSAGEGAGTMTLFVHTGGCLAAGRVAYTVTAGTALPNVDFRLAGGVLDWPVGDSSPRTITAVILPDNSVEAAIKDFRVDLTTPSPSVVVANPTGQGRILDDDGLDVKLVVNDGECPPGEIPGHALPDVHGGSINCGVHATLSQPPGPINVHWETIDGTAVAGVDFLGVSGATQVIGAGSTDAQLRVELLQRLPRTPARSFTVRITIDTASSGFRIVDALATVTLSES